MGPARPPGSSSLTGGGRRHARRPTDDGDQRAERPEASPACTEDGGPAEDGSEDDYGRALDAWWDSILQFFARHRATAALVAWLGVSAFDVLDLHMPAEWLVFTFFSFSVFVQVFGMSALLFAALAAGMTALNVAVYCLLPFSATSLLSTVVVCMLLVRGVHGLDARGWLVTALMSASRLSTPWCETLPAYLQEPVAAYCASFGLLWIVYHSSGRLEHLIDPACLLLGVVPPQPPHVSVVEIGDSSIVVCWSPDAATGGLLPTDLAPAQLASAAHHKGAASPPDTPHTPAPPPPVECPVDAAGAATAAAGDPTLQTCSPTARARRQLADALTVSYEIEVDGRIVGARSRADELARIQGLQPARTYQVRVWALSQSRGRAPSAPVFVTTAATPENEASDRSAADSQLEQQQQPLDDAPADIDSVYSEITTVREATVELEQTAAAVREQADAECAGLQEEAAELRAKRKEAEDSKTAQRESIQEMEAEKRRLDRTRAALREEIAAAAARRQRAHDRRLDQERRAEAQLRQAEALEAKTERERRDYESEKTALQSTIDSLKLETASIAQRRFGLSREQEETLQQLRSKRAELAAQEKENTSMDGRIKKAIQRRRQLNAAQHESTSIVAQLQAEVDALEPRLEAAVAQRRQREAAAASLAPLQDPPAVAHRPPAHPASFGGDLDRGCPTTSNVPAAAASHAPISLPPRIRRGTGPADLALTVGRHARSSSVAINSATADSTAAPPALHCSAHHSALSLSQFPAGRTAAADGALVYGGVPVRRSADLDDLLGLWHRKSTGLVPGMSAAPARHSLLWAGPASPPAASVPTTAAEASALSILKDTDLAYPSPKRPPYGSSGPFGDPAGYGGVPFPQPPPEVHSGFGGKLHHLALDRVLVDPLESARPPPACLGSGGSWPDADYLQGLSLGAGLAGHPTPSLSGDTATGYQSASPYAPPLADLTRPFVLRAGSPAEQPQHLFSGDMLGMRRPADVYAPGGRTRPHVAPIGAPGRGRREGSLASRRPSTLSHENLPLARAGAGADDVPQPSAESQSCRASLDNAAARSSPFNESLYCEHSFWEQDATGER